MGPGLSAAAAAAGAVPQAAPSARMEFLEPPGLASPVRPERAPAALERAAPVPTGDRDAAQAVARPTEAKRSRESQVASQRQISPETRWSRDSGLAGQLRATDGRCWGGSPRAGATGCGTCNSRRAPRSIRVHRAAPPRTASCRRRGPVTNGDAPNNQKGRPIHNLRTGRRELEAQPL